MLPSNFNNEKIDSSAIDFIAICIGNSQITSGLFSQEQLIKTWYHNTADIHVPAEALINFLKSTPQSIKVGICSVVPAATKVFTTILNSNRITFCEIGAQKPHPLKNIYSTFGADRLANAAAAWEYYNNGNHVAVIDYGTTTTLETVSPDGEFCGGLITLGLGKILNALHIETALLPEICLDNDAIKSLELAFNTEHAIISGVISSHIGLTKNWIEQTKNQLGKQTTIIATGGWAKTLSFYTKSFDYVDQGLTLKGIRSLSNMPIKVKSKAKTVG